MTGQNGHLTFKVVLGYILLIATAICLVSYIYNIVEQVAGEEDTDGTPRHKVYLVTNTLSLLYESEAFGQLVGTSQNEFRHFNRTLDKALRNMETFRTLVTDSSQLLKIDTINILVERKRWNTRRLLETWNNTNTERLYAENIEKIIAVQDTLLKETEVPVQVQERVEIKQDTLVIAKKHRGFFRRIADVFAPAQEDTGIVVNTTREIVRDTLMNAFNPTDTIVSVLRGIRDSVADQRKQLLDILFVRAANLRYNNSVITSKINQMLRDIEEEEMNTSLARMHKKQELLKEASQLIAGIAIVSILVAILFMIFISRDISRSKYYRLQLEKAKQYAEDLLQSREQLMLTISHDIRAPLSSIIGYIELLLRRHPDDRQRYYLENMTASSKHIFSLVNDLLDFHRLASGQIEFHQVPFSVPILFREIYTSFLPMAEAKGLQFTLNLKEEETKLMEQVYSGDSIRIRQILGNLLSNAIKFTDEGRVVIVVSIQQPSSGSSQLSVIVSDSGTGISEAEQEKIFGEFTRLPGAEGAEGFGLGLSITRHLIQQMGGTLSLQSTIGRGTDFTILLPLLVSEMVSVPSESTCVEADVAYRRPAQPLLLSSGRQVSCLLVDDDPLQLAFTEEVLKQSQVQVTCCALPHTVLGLLQNKAFDVIMTDIQMPGMNGFRLLDLIRTSGIPGTDRIPVVALSASVSKEQRQYVEAGFTAFLNKPFTAVQLVELLNTLLAAHLQAGDELNIASLTAFAAEDKEASASILHTFSDETRKSIALLEQALRDADREEASRVCHKLIPLFTMLGAGGLVECLSCLEKEETAPKGAVWEQMLQTIIMEITAVVIKVETSHP